MIAEFESLSSLLAATAKRFPDRGFLYPGLNRRLTYSQLWERSGRVATALASRWGDDRPLVAISVGSSPEFLVAFFGVLGAGGVPVALPTLDTRGPAARRTRSVLVDGGIREVLTANKSAGLLGDLHVQLQSMGADLLTVERLEATQCEVAQRRAVSEFAFIQYTSGSTSNPKGVAVSHAGALANLEASRLAAEMTSSDVFCGWVPEFHDLGLVGNLLMPLALGCEASSSSPLAFVRRPLRWLRHLAELGGTVMTSPNFGYRLMLEAADGEDLRGLDLSKLRLAYNGAEAVDAGLMDRFVERFEPYGFDRQSLFCVYGLAEVTVAATFPRPREGMTVDWVDRESLGTRGVARTVEPCAPGGRRVVGLGTALPGHQVAIKDASGNSVGRRVVGEVCLAGPSTMAGYYRKPEATAAVLKQGWLHTGDLGYLDDAGMLFVVGRQKELIIRAGANYYPEDVETVVRSVEGVHRGSCAAFAVGEAFDTAIACIVETRLRDRTQQQKLRESIERAIAEETGLSDVRLLLVRPGTVERTTSGKSRRLYMRHLYMSGELAEAS